MGTRSLTIVKDGNNEVLNMYRQMDGYPSGHGRELKHFLEDFQICNGFGSEQSNGKWANGMGCLAAQIVAHFKEGIGQFYLNKSGQRDCGEQYIYTLTETKSHAVNVKVYEVYDKKVLYDGPIKDFNPKD